MIFRTSESQTSTRQPSPALTAVPKEGDQHLRCDYLPGDPVADLVHGPVGASPCATIQHNIRLARSDFLPQQCDPASDTSKHDLSFRKGARIT